MKRAMMWFWLLLPLLVASQEKGKPSQLRYRVFSGISLQAGEGALSWQWQLVGAVTKNNWVAGIGTGMDYYRYRAVPVFLSVRKEELFRSRFFGYADAGLNVPLVTDSQKKPFAVKNTFQPGVYAETGAGIRVASRGRWSLLVSAGYGIRSLKEKAVYPNFNGPDPSEHTIITYRHTFHQVNIRAVIGFRGR